MSTPLETIAAPVKKMFTWQWVVGAIVAAIATTFIVNAFFKKELVVTDENGKEKTLGTIKERFRYSGTTSQTTKTA